MRKPPVPTAIILCLFAAILTAPTARAQDDMQAVGAVWADFVGSLRRGAYPSAHSLFSPGSRNAMPYPEFVSEYGPLSAAREMVLAKPESLGTALDGDWAEITYGGTTPGTGRKFKVDVAFVKNQGAWGLVAARNESVERVEAGARSLLALIWNARAQGTPKELVTALNAAHAKNPVLQLYRIETDGRTVRAFPQKSGLRTFSLDNTGMVKAMGDPDQNQLPASAEQLQIPTQSVLLPGDLPPEAVKPAAPQLLENGMPELAEPPPRSGRGAGSSRMRAATGLEEELPEPRGATSRGAGLPDTIH